MTPRAARLRVLLLVLLLAVPAGVALADFLDNYRDGLEALEAGDPATAETLFREAIAGRAEEAKRLMKGLYLKPYLPYYYLGVSLAEQGDCTGALEAWDESERQGAISERPEELADLQARRESCREQLEERRSAFGEARRAVEAAAAVAASVDTLARTPELSSRWSEGSPSLGDRQRRAAEELVSARRRLDGAQDAAGAQDARRRAEGARRLFMEVRQAALGEREAVRDERRELTEEIGETAAEARAALERAAQLDPRPPEVERLTARLEAELGRRGGLDGASPDELRRYRDGLRDGVRRLGAASAPPPGELIAAAQAYLEGRPETVLETLAKRKFRDPRARAHALLLTAAARFALYERGGSEDEALLEQTRADLGAAFEADSGLMLSERIFPPRFRALRESPPPPSASGSPPAP